ncbi:MAG TPA: PAS domain-containing protein [Candidatus Acidoferrum sp.]|nr:PAS domain-containing protein [Candidatus Acidoferrum sp.]
MLAHAHPELKEAKYVVFVDASRRYVDCSDGVRELLGYSREEMLSKKIEDISYDVGAVPILFGKYLQNGTLDGEYVLQRSDRTPLPIRYRAFVLGDGCRAAIWEPVGGWTEIYLAALLETDPVKQKAKIKRALAAIEQNASAAEDERRRMTDALAMLSALQRARE